MQRLSEAGQVADFYKPYHKLEARIARGQRKLSHMVEGSSNHKKQSRYIAKLHAKAKHQRNDMLHKLSYRLTEQYDVISIEDLNMAAIKKALHFGKSASDNGWGNFTRMLVSIYIDSCLVVSIHEIATFWAAV